MTIAGPAPRTRPRHSPAPLAATLAVAFGVLAAGTARAAPPGGLPTAPLGPRSPDGVPRRLILAVDGIPYDLFVEAQRRGFFAGFGPPARMVSTFPSLTDVSFSAIGGSPPPDGYQVMRFDRDENRVVGNTLGALSMEAHRHLPIDSKRWSAGHRMGAYLMPRRAVREEMRKISAELLASDRETFTGYVEASDALLHVEGAWAASQVLAEVDADLTVLRDEVRRRTGRELLVDVVSDHGSTLVSGRPARIEEMLRRCGWVRRKRLADDHSVAYSLAGSIGSVAITGPPGAAEEIGRCLVRAPGVDAVTWARDDAVVVASRRGEAEVRPVAADESECEYRRLSGDPLGLLPALGYDDDTAPREIRIAQELVFERTADGAWPDPLRRTWRAFHGAVKEPPDVLVSLEDGWEAGNGAVRTMAHVRGRAGTHGSLTRLASLGVLASTWRPVRDVDSWSARDVLLGDETLHAARDASRAAVAQPGATGSPSPVGPVSRARSVPNRPRASVRDRRRPACGRRRPRIDRC